MLGLALGFVAATAHSAVADFLALPRGAREAALGDAGTALVEDADALDWNPAALAGLPRTQASFGALPVEGTGRLDHVAFAHNFGARGTVAVGASVFSVGDVTVTDIEGTSWGDASPQDRTVTLGYARHLSFFPRTSGYAGGFSVSRVDARLIRSAGTATFGGGVLSPPLAGGRIRWGLAAHNLAGALTYGNERERLPQTFRAGARWSLSPRWMTAGDLVWRRGDALDGGAGLEYRRALPGTASLYLRTGASVPTSGDGWTESLRGGFGVEWRALRVDYFLRGWGGGVHHQGMTVHLRFTGGARLLSPAIQSMIDLGQRQIEGGQYPEAVLTFDQVLRMSPGLPEARDGLERAYGLMNGR
jgi:hypothetical protein